MKKRNEFIRLRVICTPSMYDAIGSELVARIRACGLVVGKTFLAKVQKRTQYQIDKGWQASWDLQHFELPFKITKKRDAINRKERSYYEVPGVPGLIFTDNRRILDVRDTRRDTDWDKLSDKRVVRRMYRQMAKNFSNGGELKMARGHKR